MRCSRFFRNYFFLAQIICALTGIFAQNAGAQERNGWFLPGAELTKATAKSPTDVSVTVSFDPAQSPDLFKYYVSADKDLLKKLKNLKKPYEFTLSPGTSQKPDAQLGIEFHLEMEGKYACVYAVGPNRQGITKWRVRRSIIEEKLEKCDQFFQAFAGSPSVCHEVENCVPSAECSLNGGVCDISKCCAQHLSAENDKNHCFDVEKLKLPDPVDPDALARTGGDIIPESCWNGAEPEASQLAKTYKGYRSMLGVAANCIEGTLKNLLFDDAGGTRGTVFTSILSKVRAFVRAALALGIIAYAYNFIYGAVNEDQGKKQLPDNKDHAWMFLKVVLTVYFAAGDGLAKIYLDVWPSSKGMAALVVLSASGYKGVTGGSGGTAPQPTPPDDAKLVESAENYAEMLRAANRALAYHRELSEEFDALKGSLGDDCPNLSPYANGGKLLDKAPQKSGSFPLSVQDAIQKASDKVNDLVNCNVERSCDLVSFKDNKGIMQYRWKAVDTKLAGLYNMGRLSSADQNSTCEVSMIKNLLPNNLSDESVKNALGGAVGAAYRDVKREGTALFDKYQTYYDMAERVRNHNILIYYYKESSDGDEKLEAIKGDLFSINNQITTAEKRLAEIDGYIADLQKKSFNEQACVQKDPTAQADIDQRNALDQEIAGLQQQIDDLQKKLTDAQNATPPDAALVTSIGAQITPLRNQLTKANSDRGKVLLNLQAKGCVGGTANNQTLDELLVDQDKLRKQLDQLRDMKGKATAQDIEVQLDYAKLLARLEVRLAYVYSHDKEYYRELYCALHTLELDANGNVTGKYDFSSCPMDTNNMKPICLDKDMYLQYAAASLLKTNNDVPKSLIMEMRTKCGVIDPAGTGFGEGTPPTNVPAAKERSAILHDFHEVVPFAMESLYESADQTCMEGGKILDVSAIVGTLPPDDVFPGEQAHISQNDTKNFNASDAPSEANPYMSYGTGNASLRYRMSNRKTFYAGQLSKLGTSMTLSSFPDMPIGKDCDGYLDGAMLNYCVKLFGKEIGGEAVKPPYTYMSETFAGFEEYGAHGCNYYLTRAKPPLVPEKGLLDIRADVDLLCPERDSQDIPVTETHAWNFPEKSLREGGLLNGTQRKYYACASNGKWKSATTGIPGAYRRLVELFGTIEGFGGGDLNNEVQSFCSCVRFPDAEKSKCVARVVNAGTTGTKGEVREVLETLLGLKYDLEREEAKKAGFALAPDNGTIVAGLGVGQQATAIYPYCNAIPADKKDPFFLLWDILDCKFQRYLGFGSPGSTTFSYVLPKTIIVGVFGLSPLILVNAIMAIVNAVLITLVIFRMVLIYLAAMMGLAVWLFIGPIIIPLVFFSETQGIFNGWLRRVIGLFVQPILLAMVFLYYFMILDMGFFGGNQTFGAVNDITPGCGGAFCDPYTLAHAVQESHLKWFIIPYVGYPGSTGGIGLDYLAGSFRMLLAIVGINILGPLLEGAVNSVAGMGAGSMTGVTSLPNPVSAFAKGLGAGRKAISLGAGGARLGMKAASAKSGAGKTARN
ncbi:MAG: type IV secretion system protein [Rickettsiales bacterium]